MQLQVITGPDKGRTFVLSLGEPLLVGRSQATQTRLSDQKTSRIHCEIQWENDQVVVIDSNSTGGTFVNGKKVSQQALKNGHVVRVGDTELRLQDSSVADQSTLAPPPTPPVKGTLRAGAPLSKLIGQILGHYEIGSAVAQGQSGMVFKARDTKADQAVALKVMQPDFARNDEEVQRFVRAMKTMMPLKHSNLVGLLGAGKTGPYCWVAMEFVDGESLTQVIQRIGVAGMLDWRHAVRAAIHIGRALDFAHQQHIIHRNIAPPNILIQASDKVAKLGDLMLAKALEGTLAQQITRPGEIVGDVRYMSPERTRGGDDVDGRSDIYSLGATVYALLTGRPPFTGGSLVETVRKIRQAEPDKPKKYQLSIPDLFEGTILKTLAKRPEERYQKAADLLVDLERVAEFQGVAV